MVVHIQSTLTKRDDLTKEEFDKHWSEHHGGLFMKNPLAQQYLLRYSQAHFDASANESLAQAIGANPPRAFDGIANFWFATLDDAKKVFTSEYYLKVVVPDEERMIKRDQTTLFVTVDEDKWIKDEPSSYSTAN